MAKEAISMKYNIALLAKVFDFLNQLNEDQISDLLEDKASLSLDTLIDGRVDAMISEKLNSRLEEMLGALIDLALGSESSIESIAVPLAVSTKSAGSIGKGRKKGKTDVVKPRTKKSNAGASNADTLESVASAVRSLSSKESIVDYFEKNPLKVSAMKSLANRHFGISDTRKMNVEGLVSEIARVVIEPEVF